MQRIRYGLIVLAMLLCSAASATAEVSIGIWTPNVSIGINVPLYPRLVPVPGYPVYYAPGLSANYFFYDGLYWVYENDSWYASSWYNGPWRVVEPYYVPVFILRIPVRYYRRPPVYFRGWHQNAPPRWGHHWGPEWEHQRRGWDRWHRREYPVRAPLPAYQGKYSGDRYPRMEEQETIHRKQYRYEPRDKKVREHFRQSEQRDSGPAQRERGEESRRSWPRQQDRPDDARPQQYRGDETIRRSAPDQNAPQQREPASRDRRQQDFQRPDQPRQDGPEDPRFQQRGPAIQERQPDAVQREQRAPRSKDQERENDGKRRGGDEERGRGRGY